jgi:multidrug resistance efflux pump
VLSTRAGSADKANQPTPRAEESVIVNVPSERAGKLMFIATDVKPGEAVPPERAVVVTVAFLAIELMPNDETKEPTLAIEGKTYRRWKPEDPLAPGRLRVIREKRVLRQLRNGDEVLEGQWLALVNPAVAIDELDAKLARLDMAEADVRISEKTKLEAEKRYNSAIQAYRGKAISEGDLQVARLAWDRYIEEEKARRIAVLQAQAEVQTALTILSMYEIRSPVRGVIRKILKNPGEAVRELETVLQLQIAGKSEDESVKRPVRVHIPSERDGRLVCIATDIKPGEVVPENKRAKGITVAFLVLALDKDETWTGPTYTIDGKLYRPWKEGEELVPDKVRVHREKRDLRNLQVGDDVEPGQLLALVNPLLAIDEMITKVAKLHAAAADRRVAEKTWLEAEMRYASATHAYRGRAISADDWRAAKLTRDRYNEENNAKRAAVRQAQAEVQAALTTLHMYEIRSDTRGTIIGFAKKAGEGIKSLETVLQIEVADKSRK